MPDPSAFLKGYGFANAARKAGYRMSVKNAKHIPVIQFERYRYIFKLVFTPAGRAANTQLLRHLLAQITSDRSRVINSAYGNPYKCTIFNLGILADKGSPIVTVRFNATAVKIHHGSSRAATNRAKVSRRRRTLSKRRL